MRNLLFRPLLSFPLSICIAHAHVFSCPVSCSVVQVTLMSWGNVVISKVHWSGSVVTGLDGTLHLAGDVKATEKKLTWLDGSAAAQADMVPLSFVELDTLVTVPKVEEGVDFESIVNPKTWFETAGMGEAALRSVKKGDTIQISRRGFFIVESLASVPSQGQGPESATPMQLILIPDGRQKQMSTLGTKVDKAKLVGAK